MISKVLGFFTASGTKIMAVMLAVSGFVVMLLRGRIKDQKIKEQDRDIKAKETTQRVNKKATEAILRSMKDDEKPSAKRNHFGK